MFSWLDNIVGGLGGGLGELANTISTAIFETMVQWLYTSIFTAIADFFAGMGNMGAEVFDLNWVQATIRLFTLLGWALYLTGIVVAVFDVAIEYQSGRASIKTTALNVMKGFFACSLVGVVPVRLYQFCISLQRTFGLSLAALFGGEQSSSLAELCLYVLHLRYNVTESTLLLLLSLIAFAYCVVSVFFQNIKRGGILLVQIAVGSLYLFSVPRGYMDGFTQWVRQVIALCLTAFLQSTMLLLGLMTFQTDMLLGLGVILAASEVPKIAQQFGLDTSVHVNMMSVVQTTSTAVHLTRAVAGALM